MGHKRGVVVGLVFGAAATILGGLADRVDPGRRPAQRRGAGAAAASRRRRHGLRRAGSTLAAVQVPGMGRNSRTSIELLPGPIRWGCLP